MVSFGYPFQNGPSGVPRVASFELEGTSNHHTQAKGYAQVSQAASPNSIGQSFRERLAKSEACFFVGLKRKAEG